MAVAEVPVEDQLAWEKRLRPRAALLAALAGLLVLGGFIISQVSVPDSQSSLLLDSLQKLERPGPIGLEETGRIDTFEAEKDRLAVALGAQIAIALGLLLTGLAVAFLGQCTRARRSQLARWAVPLPAIGGAILGGSTLILYIAGLQLVNDVLDGPRTVDSVRNVPGSVDIAQVTLLLGQVVFALGALLVCLNAMRAGLLTRTMGIIGMFAAGFVILAGPYQPTLPLWTIFLAPLFLGRWMGGQPPAWVTGREEPWPSAAQMREERLRARGQLAEPDPEPVEQAAAERAPHPSSKKRKRKRRA